MKPQDMSWDNWLMHGVRLMEGAETQTEYVGRRCFTEAHKIFSECFNISDDTLIQLTALIRLAQLFLYRRDPKEAETWLHVAEAQLRVMQNVPTALQAQYGLVRVSLLMKHGNFTEAHTQLYQVEALERIDHKLRGDIYNMFGRLCEIGGAHVPFIGRTDDMSAYHYLKAVNEFMRATDDPLTLHALATACGHAGLALQRSRRYDDREALQCLHRAERMFGALVHDPFVQGTFWRKRAQLAFRNRKFLDGLTFLKRAIWPTWKSFRQLRS